MEITTNPDIEALSAIAIRCFSEAPWNELWTLEGMSSLLMRFQKNGCEFILLYDGEEVVSFGLVMMLGSYWEIETFPHSHNPMASYYIGALATAPEHRNQGFCSLVVKTFIQHAKHSKHQAVYVRTRQDNKQAIKVFTDLGFTKVGEQDAETGGKVSHRHVFALSLQERPK